MNEAYLLIGGNMGDRMAYLNEAITLIEESCGPVVLRSSVYETAAWGNRQQASFYNQALLVNTQLLPEVLMRTLLDIELKMGRLRDVKYGPRTIDLDILLVNGKIISGKSLTVPHPSLTERRFALQPLAEIAAQVIHPTTKKTIATLLKECPDPLEVHVVGSEK